MLKLPLNDEFNIFIQDYQKAETYIPIVVATLNKCGQGTIYFGVNNKGEAIGTLHIRNTIASVLKDFESNITPKIYPSISLLEQNKNIIKVSFCGTNRPYSYKSKFYLRDHNDIRLLDYESIMKELKFIDKEHFKEEEEISLPLRNIDEQRIKRTFETAINAKKYSSKSKSFSFKKILVNWGLSKNGKPTKAGILLYGKKLPLSLTINVYDNEKNSNIIETKFMKGNILEFIDFLLPYLKKTYIEKFRIKNSAYPENIIKEIIINAFLHANYYYGNEFIVNLSPYKISVLNPGKFPDEYFPEDFAFTHARPIITNKIIGKILGYECLASLSGKGFKLLFENKKDIKPYSMKQNGSMFQFTYFIYTDKNKYLSIDKAVISILSEKPFVKSEEIAKKIGKTRRTVQTILKELKEKNLIVRKGSKKTGYWVVNK